MALSTRLLALIALTTLAFTSAFAQEPGKSITYRTVAKTADVVVGELADLTGLDLQVSSDAKRHVLVLSVKDASIDDVLTHVASVTSSTWQITGETRRLIADAQVRRREDQVQIDVRAAKIRVGLDALREQLKKEPVNSPMAGMTFGGGGSLGSPAARALARLALLLDPKEVARLSEGGRIVFATTPNRMQRSMRGGQVNQILNGLVAEHNEYVEKSSADRQKMLEDVDGQMAGMSELMETMFGNTEPRKFESVPSKAVLVVESGGALFFAMDGTQIELVVYDQLGQAIAQASAPLSTSDFMTLAIAQGSGPAEEDPARQDPPSKADMTPIKLSENSELYRKYPMVSQQGPSSVPDELMEILRRPDLIDPLSFSQSDALLSIADAKGLNVVANLPDGTAAQMFVGAGAEQSATVGQAFKQFADSDEYDLTEEDGWLEIRPADPVAARELRQDRSALAALIAVAERKGAVDLETLSSFARLSPPPMQNGTAISYLGVFAPTALQGIMGDTMQWDMLQLYASLGPSIKAALRQGREVPFSSITAAGRKILERMAFGANANIMPTAGLVKSASEPQFLQMMRQMMPGQRKDFTEEPTEVMPNGLPGNGTLSLSITQVPIANAEKGGGMTMFGIGAIGPDEIAMMEFFGEASPEIMDSITQGMGELRIGSREQLRFTFQLSPDAGMSKTLYDDSVDKEGQMVSITNLPANFRLLVDKAKEQLKNSPMARLITMFGMGRETTVKPPAR